MTLAAEISDFVAAVAAQINLLPKRRVTSVSYASSVTPNCGTTDILNIGTLTGALTINIPTGTPVDGQNLRFRIVNDGTGRVVTFTTGTNGFLFGTDITQAMITALATASAKYEVMCTWDATSSKWRVVSLIRGF